MNRHLQILGKLRDEVRVRLQQSEGGPRKLYSAGPGGASIDGTSEYLSTLRQQLEKLETVVAAMAQSP